MVPVTGILLCYKALIVLNLPVQLLYLCSSAWQIIQREVEFFVYRCAFCDHVPMKPLTHCTHLPHEMYRKGTS